MVQESLKLGPAPMPDADFLPWDDIAECDSELDAIQMCWRRRKWKCSQRQAAEVIGRSKGTLSKYLDGQLTMPTDVRVAFQRSVCRNMAITQYEAYAGGYILAKREVTESEKREQEVRELRERLAELESRAA